MRDAESILDQVIAYSGEHISERDVTDVIGVVERQLVVRHGRGVIAQDAKGGLTSHRAHSRSRVTMRTRCTKALVSFLRDMLMIRVWERQAALSLHR